MGDQVLSSQMPMGRYLVPSSQMPMGEGIEYFIQSTAGTFSIPSFDAGTGSINKQLTDTRKNCLNMLQSLLI